MFKRMPALVIFKNWIWRKITGNTYVSFTNTVKAHRSFENKNADVFVQALLPQSVKDRITRGEPAPKLPR